MNDNTVFEVASPEVGDRVEGSLDGLGILLLSTSVVSDAQATRRPSTRLSSLDRSLEPLAQGLVPRTVWIGLRAKFETTLGANELARTRSAALDKMTFRTSCGTCLM